MSFHFFKVSEIDVARGASINNFLALGFLF